MKYFSEPLIVFLYIRKIEGKGEAQEKKNEGQECSKIEGGNTLRGHNPGYDREEKTKYNGERKGIKSFQKT